MTITNNNKKGLDDNLDDSDDEFIPLVIPKEMLDRTFVRSTKHQREYISRLAASKHLHYNNLVKFCNKIIRGTGKPEIRDIGELNISEADRMIKELQLKR